MSNLLDRKKSSAIFWIKNVFLIQNRNFRNFDFSSKMSILDEEKHFDPKKSLNFFFDSKILTSRQNMFFWIFISRVKIPPGIQKSYLERRAMSANMLKMQILNLVVIENSPKPWILGYVHHLQSAKYQYFARNYQRYIICHDMFLKLLRLSSYTPIFIALSPLLKICDPDKGYMQGLDLLR